MRQADRTTRRAEASPRDIPPKTLESLRRVLERDLEGEVRFDALSRALYSTDASNYQIMPSGVVIPRHRDDIVKTVRACAEHGVPLVARGGGTALSGQGLCRGLIVDLSKYMHRILEVNTVEKWAWVEPGVVLDELNLALAPDGLHFPPDVATSNRATIGGMIANNSAGAHSLIYGKTIDHVLETEVVLSDGSVAHFGELDDRAPAAGSDNSSLAARCRAVVARLGREHADEIERRYPKTLRRVGGYNLDAFVPGRPVNLSRMIVGSEGTLGIVTKARLNLVDLPKAKALLVCHFATRAEALAATTAILAHEPAAIEFIDDVILRQTQGSREYAPLRDFVVGDPAALLAVEFFAGDAAQLPARIERLEADLRARGMGYHYYRALAPAAQDRVWKLRKAGLGLLMSMKGDAKPVAFVEDAAVPIERLAEYIDRVVRIVESNGTTAAMYAHASVGCLHVRPILNLKTEEGIRQYAAIAEAVSDLALEFGGAFSAEHGDGRVRSPFNEKMYGPVLYQAFREIKQAFDPQGLFNPGVIVDAEPMTANLRFGPGYETRDIATTFDFSADGGIQRAAELCSGVGLCRKKIEGTMCPSFMATLEEKHSTRGRANALRLAMTGQLGRDGLTSPEVLEALDLCLECKACKTECPTSTDVAKLKYEVLHQFYKRRGGAPLRARMFAHIERLMALGSRFAPLSTWAARSWPARVVIEALFGIDRRRRLPPFARETFTRWFTRRGGRIGYVPNEADPARSVVLFHDTFLTYNDPQIGIAVVRLLESAGWRVFLPDKKCCGRPMISKGLLDEAIANAKHNVERLLPLAERGFRIVGCEPSCILTFRDDYPELLRGEWRRKAEIVAAAAMTFEEFLAGALESGSVALDLRSGPRRVLLHGHCHQKALVGTRPSRAILSIIPGCEVEEIDSGCCGMAGSFGFEKEHFEWSQAIGERRLLPAVREAGRDTAIVAAGTSCRQQIADFTARRALHPAELLASLLAEEIESPS